jgi:hypothetical protein
VTHFGEGLSPEAVFTLKVVKYLICLVGTWRPSVSIIGKQFILFLKTLGNKYRRITKYFLHYTAALKISVRMLRSLNVF